MDKDPKSDLIDLMVYYKVPLENRGRSRGEVQQFG
jgi:hypothetical protein